MILRALLLAALCTTGACSSDAKEKRNPAVDGDDDDIVELTMTWDAYGTKGGVFSLYAIEEAEIENDDVVPSLIQSDITPDDLAAPKVTLSSEDNSLLELFFGKKTCFFVAMIIDGVESEHSNKSCVDL